MIMYDCVPVRDVIDYKMCMLLYCAHPIAATPSHFPLLLLLRVPIIDIVAYSHAMLSCSLAFLKAFLQALVHCRETM